MAGDRDEASGPSSVRSVIPERNGYSSWYTQASLAETMSTPRFVPLAESVASVGYREAAIGPRRHFDPVSHPVMCRRRRRSVRGSQRRHRRQWRVEHIRDEQTRHRVLLPTHCVRSSRGIMCTARQPTDHRHGVFDFAHAIHSSPTASRSRANRDISLFVIIA
jgi:hypothetical protein